MINIDKWEEFKAIPPFKKEPFTKRNWGNKQHSLCSFYGKLKPAISYHLVDTFSSKGDKVLDCFCGSGTIPFEASLNGRHSFGIDINPISIVISNAKVKNQSAQGCEKVINDLDYFIRNSNIDDSAYEKAKIFGYNKPLQDYYHPNTFAEILKARKFFQGTSGEDANYSYVLSCLLHILHGNRPYALSRRSHPITPYAPTGEYENKSLIEKLYEKASRSFESVKSLDFIEGDIFKGDILKDWHDDINNIDAIITSPPFFDSTKFYLVHWLRSWFLGWEKEDFDKNKLDFIGEKQKKDFTLYSSIFQQSKDRLKPGGVLVLHLGKSKKKNMGEYLEKMGKEYFKKVELFDEDVSLLEKHGIKDKGSVSSHQYLVLY